jgi:hypothetical protein
MDSLSQPELRQRAATFIDDVVSQASGEEKDLTAALAKSLFEG